MAKNTYQTRIAEIVSAARTISAARAALFAALDNESKNNKGALLALNAFRAIWKADGIFDEYCKYMNARYKGAAPKKGYSLYYITQFFDKKAKELAKEIKTKQELKNQIEKYLNYEIWNKNTLENSK